MVSRFFFKSEIWGVIVVDSIENRKFFTKDNLVFLDFVSNVLSLTLNNVSRLEELEDENSALKNNFFKNEGIEGIIGSSDVMQKIIQLVAKVSKTDATVLILGESGTGKDLFAQAIHKLSKRNNAQFVAQFCGSIPDNLLESELFGFKKGSFTGAVSDKKGLFEVADRGTFFLDEIADVSAALQAKLLRVIQNKEIIRIGETEVRKVDVRIIAATNKDLKEMIKQGTFREDLFYRLNVFPVTIPPLRDRKGDVPLLANHFLKKYSDDQKIKFSKEALKNLNLIISRVMSASWRT
ncbi:MAG: sigma 54-interacting transcriptional regulator [Ignavibacteriales bacterium]|nr:sigma 54-interacting transcriptional regulator [Ignavibacteriales bacterium]